MKYKLEACRDHIEFIRGFQGHTEYIPDREETITRGTQFHVKNKKALAKWLKTGNWVLISTKSKGQLI